MSLVRPDQRGIDTGVLGFRSWVRALAASGLPVLFLPGAFTSPRSPHRKLNTIDLGTADKVAVAALALEVDAYERGQDVKAGLNVDYSQSTFAVVELGSAFSAVLVVSRVGSSTPRQGPAGRSVSGPVAVGTVRWPTGGLLWPRTTSFGVA